MDAMLEAEEMLGPVEPPLNFLRYQRNFTSRERSHLFFDPFHLYPFTPFQPIMPGDAKFLGNLISHLCVSIDDENHFESA